MKTIALLLVLVGSTALVTSCGLFCPDCQKQTYSK